MGKRHFYKERTMLILLIICLSQIPIEGLLGQTIDVVKQIADFKSDFLISRLTGKVDTLHTSNAILFRERWQDLRVITTIIPKDSLKIREYYYNDTDILQQKLTMRLPSNRYIGSSSFYDISGNLEYIIDFDKGAWTVQKFDHFPYAKQLYLAKEKADSIIIHQYGLQFFQKHVVWTPENSAFYSLRGAGNTWFNYQNWQPYQYLLRYHIKVNEDEVYDEAIEIRLDSLLNYRRWFKGLEHFDSAPEFALNKNSAVAKAKEYSLLENDTSHAICYLQWQFFGEKNTGFCNNGRFVYQVILKTKTITYPPVNGRSRMETKYDVYDFNPWTGAFIGKKKMKKIKEWEQNSASESGLIPDD